MLLDKQIISRSTMEHIYETRVFVRLCPPLSVFGVCVRASWSPQKKYLIFLLRLHGGHATVNARRGPGIFESRPCVLKDIRR